MIWLAAFKTENKVIKIIYPELNKKEQWTKAMNEAFTKGFLSKQELTQCIEMGGTSEDLMKKIKTRIDVFGIIFRCS